ncbi:hypothetical protein TOPH_00211 [Tolypocladium ophioglossoides CBS 100239]|uniref:Yeast cell wall synthesis Kre9/Knh1-like N-terminal domain-containing protein n=1 Tax=Tolypocladium ophioglossoides (strain CBS 100239) TaxID=1163406 RepID=A0A0L0NLM1_TOLOC|nr:hypothetical protein TOPH_00211 [Tolypocladium ophioglossoides CBS 100239]
MRFSLSVTAVLAMAASAFAQTADFDPIFTPTPNEVVPAGSTFTITWEAPAKYAGDTISIHLIGGATQGQQVPLLDIAAGVKNSAKSYSWQVDASLGAEKVYGLVFKLESNPAIFQYSNPFQIKASDTKSTGSATVTLTTSHGIKTVTLSSTSTPVTTTTTSTPVTTSASVATSSYVKHNTTTSYTYSSTVPCNSTTLATSPGSSLVVITSTTLVNNPTPTAPTTVPIKSTAAAPIVGTGSLSILGGLLVAFLAL